MKQLRIQLIPPEPYFLGGERIFEIGDGNKHYYIRSLSTPSQTTLFGILRYLGIVKPNRQMQFDPDNIGPHSYRLDTQDGSYGRIINISPLYLMDDQGAYYVKTPFDHIPGNFEEDEKEYEPFSEYVTDAEPVGAGGVQKRYPSQYNAKHELADSWMCISQGEKYKKTYKNKNKKKNLFESDNRVGIDKQKTEKAFVKKEYSLLKRGFSFVFFANVEDDFQYAEERFVEPGFYARVTEDAEPTFPADVLRNDILYAQSDIFISSEDAQKLYSLCEFVCVDTKSFRGRVTNVKAQTLRERFKRYDRILTLIQAGSVFKVGSDNLDAAKDLLGQNKQAIIAGFNKIISGGNI